MKQVYYGWYVVAIALVINALLVGATSAAFNIFVLPVSQELHLSRAEMNTALVFQHIGNAVLSPFIGRLLDRAPTRPVMMTCALVFALSYFIMGFAHAPWISALVIGIGIPIAYLGSGSLTNTLLIARWFKGQRGRAMQLAGLGLYGGTVIAPPLVGLLIEWQGWRTALMIIGVAIGAVLFTFGVIIRDRPGPNDVEAVGADSAAQAAKQPAAPPIKVPVLIRTRDFWLMAVSGSIAVSVSQGVFVTLVPLGRDNGLSMLQAASLTSVLGGAGVVGGLLFSTIADKVNRVFFLTGMALLVGLPNVVLMADKSFAVLIACAATLGFSLGTFLPAFYALLADRFGSESFGTVRGATFTLFGIVGMITVRFSGEVFDRTGNYNLMFATFAVIQVVAAAMMFATRFSGGRAAVASPEPIA